MAAILTQSGGRFMGKGITRDDVLCLILRPLTSARVLLSSTTKETKETK